MNEWNQSRYVFLHVHVRSTGYLSSGNEATSLGSSRHWPVGFDFSKFLNIVLITLSLAKNSFKQVTVVVSPTLDPQQRELMKPNRSGLLRARSKQSKLMESAQGCQMTGQEWPLGKTSFRFTELPPVAFSMPRVGLSKTSSSDLTGWVDYGKSIFELTIRRMKHAQALNQILNHKNQFTSTQSSYISSDDGL